MTYHGNPYHALRLAATRAYKRAKHGINGNWARDAKRSRKPWRGADEEAKKVLADIKHGYQLVPNQERVKYLNRVRPLRALGYRPGMRRKKVTLPKLKCLEEEQSSWE